MTTNKMNPEAKSLLVAALRSGKYEQAAGYLRTPFVDEATGKAADGFCCLGVLCDVAVKNGIDLDVGRGISHTAYMYDSESAYLPAKVQAWSGLNDVGDFPGETEWHVSNGEIYTSLIEANDDGRTFEEIADFIEREF